MEQLNHDSWEAFKEHCRGNLADMELNNFTIYHWLKAVKETKRLHIDCYTEQRPYETSRQIGSAGCPLCAIATQLDNYLQDADKTNACTYCPWTLVASLDEFLDYYEEQIEDGETDMQAGDLHIDEIAPCSEDDLRIANISGGYRDDLMAIQRLTIWEDLLMAIYKPADYIELYDSELEGY